VSLPNPAPAFFVPASRPIVLNLSTPPVADLSATGRPVRFTDWGECLSRRHERDWPTAGHACVAVGISEPSPASDTLRLALLVITPARGLTWPRVHLIAEQGRWRAALISAGGE